MISRKDDKKTIPYAPWNSAIVEKANSCRRIQVQHPRVLRVETGGLYSPLPIIEWRVGS